MAAQDGGGVRLRRSCAERAGTVDDRGGVQAFPSRELRAFLRKPDLLWNAPGQVAGGCTRGGAGDRVRPGALRTVPGTTGRRGPGRSARGAGDAVVGNVCDGVGRVLRCATKRVAGAASGTGCGAFGGRSFRAESSPSSTATRSGR